MKVNGAERSGDVEPRVLLVDFLRTNLRLTGTHVGCDTSSCGACTVLLDAEPVKSCTVLAVQAEGRSITTVEGLAQGANLSPIQVGFHEEHGLQCGFCTPASANRSSAMRTAASSAARATTSMTSSCQECCTWRSCAARTHTRASSLSTPRLPVGCPA